MATSTVRCARGIERDSDAAAAGLTSTSPAVTSWQVSSDEKLVPFLKAVVQAARAAGISEALIHGKNTEKMMYNKVLASECIVHMLRQSGGLQAVANAIQPFSHKPLEAASFAGKGPRIDLPLWQVVFHRSTGCEMYGGSEFVLGGVTMWKGFEDNKRKAHFTPIKVRLSAAIASCALLALRCRPTVLVPFARAVATRICASDAIRRGHVLG